MHQTKHRCAQACVQLAANLPCRLLFLALIFFSLHAVAESERAPVMLANVYRPGMALDDYWVSEKYDGVRAYWDGRRLLTRGGEVIHAPQWFVAGWPAVALDGELWAGRGRFQEAVSTVRQQTPDDAAWRRLRFMAFDLPAQQGDFDRRLLLLRNTVRQMNVAWVQAVEQVKVADHAALQAMLDRIVAQGGEGLMLHRGASLYRAERNDDLLKFKPHEDAEARVVGYAPGKGKYTGMTGALLVETPDGVRFKLGSGLTDEQRRRPPLLGSVVTYRYRGYNDSGIPRFAVFMRIREE
ncbi:DNA ligase [Herbaspirillum sp. RV1423]|uniref:DNA ligase n=1 Tax=Herbaspirillum sp. RV1423 TaxID=1443993 RepID=UPI0004AFD072|nr:DNA ligase [Herbaspirillum sp. RV1423]